MYKRININYKSVILVRVLSFLQYMESGHCISCIVIFKGAMFILCGLFRKILISDAIPFLYFFINV